MNWKIITMLVLVFAITFVAAAGTITGTSELVISNSAAGGSATAEFSFDYPGTSAEYPNQGDEALLIIKVDITSEDSVNYPVWKGDFDLSGSMVNYAGWFSPDRGYNFDCYENDFTYYYAGAPQTMTGIPNGTFYCYNPGFSAMRIDSSNDVTLDIGSNIALWPGDYNVSVGLYYPQEEYINVDVTSVSSHATVNQNSTVEFNLSFEISGGNAVQMKMSDFIDGFVAPDGIGFVIGNGTSYTAEELNARLEYNGTSYSVGENYSDMNGTIVFPAVDGIARGVAVFKMDIKDYMEAGNYHGAYQFDVTEVL